LTTESRILVESLKPNDFMVIRGRRMAGRYISSPAVLRASALTIESPVLLLIVLPQRGQIRECPAGASVLDNSMSQSGQAIRWSKLLLFGCNVNLCLILC
jgi:hypothetical protein